MQFDPNTARTVSLKTTRRNGAEVATPVWIAAASGHSYVFSESRAGKVKRIRHTPQVQLAECDMRGKLRGPWVDARARIVAEPAAIDAAYAAFRAKYGWQMRILDFIAKLNGRYAKRAMIEIDLGEPFL